MDRIDTSKICGNIKIVKRFPDYKVQIVDEDADLEVELIHTHENSPGKWNIVNGYADYQIKLVNSQPDFTISCKDEIKPARY
jgi:hypothetical protein